MKIILGIGNIGDLYTDTRHNSGFQALDLFASDFGLSFTKKDFKSMIAKGKAFGEDVLLLKPTTYVNLSDVLKRKGQHGSENEREERGRLR